MSSCQGDPGQGHSYNHSITSPCAHSHKKHSLPQSTHPANCSKKSWAHQEYIQRRNFPPREVLQNRLFSAKCSNWLFSARTGETSGQGLSIQPCPAALLQGCCTWDCPCPCSSLWRDPRCAAPMGCPGPGTAWGEPRFPSRCFHPDYCPSRASSRQGRVSLDVAMASPGFGDQMGSSPPGRAHRNDITHPNANHNICFYYYFHKL